MNLWNPKFPTKELPGLNETLRHHLHCDGYRTVRKLDCPKEQLLSIGYEEKDVREIKAALKQHRRFVKHIETVFASEGLTESRVKQMWPFDLLALPFTCKQLGYILRWQLDVGGRWGEQEMFCVAEGRVYYCTKCPYKDERSNFCGWCAKKLLDDVREGKRRV